MTEEQKAYHELETMQELELLQQGTNICEILDDYVEYKKNQQEVPEETNVELENHMVVGEYYDNKNGGDNNE